MGRMKDALITIVTHVYGNDDAKCDDLQRRIMAGDPLTAEEIVKIQELPEAKLLGLNPAPYGTDFNKPSPGIKVIKL